MHAYVPGILPDFSLGACALLELEIRPRAHDEDAGVESIRQTRDNIDGLWQELAFVSLSALYIWGIYMQLGPRRLACLVACA